MYKGRQNHDQAIFNKFYEYTFSMQYCCTFFNANTFAYVPAESTERALIIIKTYDTTRDGVQTTVWLRFNPLQC